VNYDDVDKAKGLFSEIGVHQLSDGEMAFTDVRTAGQAYIHHSREPVALAAYAAVSATFAAGRFPVYALIDMVDKVPCMDATELTALAMVCGASIPTFLCSEERGEIFGRAVWDIVEAYSLQGCFEHVERAWGSPGLHYNLRPHGLNWDGGHEPVPESLKAMRKSYRAMSPLQQIMVLTIMHLYNQGKDKTYLTGGCPTKIPAAEAMDILRRNGSALSAWGHMVTHYAGW
jgi:hypothetical protein